MDDDGSASDKDFHSTRFKTETDHESGKFPNEQTISSTLPPVLDKLQTLDRVQTGRAFNGSTFGKNFLYPPVPPRTTHSRSAENIKFHYRGGHSIGDPEIHPSNVYLDVRDYKSFFGVCDESPNVVDRTGETSLEPKYNWEYDSETLKALNRVTKKFDSFRMRQLRAKCFNAADEAEIDSETKDKQPEVKSSSRASNAVDQIFCATAEMPWQAILDSEIPISPDVHSQSLVLSREEIERIDFFYSSLGCEIHVAGCLVDVLASVRGGDPGYSEGPGYRWVQVWVGVPVLVFNVGNDERKPRRLSIVIAERDTGLTLMEEKVTYSTDYRQLENEGLHFLNEGGRGKRALKIRWSDWSCARAFMQRFQQLTSDKNDPLWLQSSPRHSIDGKLLRKKPKSIFKSRDVKKHKSEVGGRLNAECKRLSSIKINPAGNERHSELVTKENISLPVDARVVTRVDSKDVHFRTTFAGLLPVHWKAKAVYTSIQNEDFRPRLPTH